jgi:hypothetical protein
MSRCLYTILVLELALTGCVYEQPGTYEHRVTIDPIRVEPIHVTADVTVRRAEIQPTQEALGTAQPSE